MVVVVLDANVLASALIDAFSTPGIVLDRAMRRDYRLVLSEHILAATLRALSKPYFRARISGVTVQSSLYVLRNLTTLVVPDSSVRGVADDEEDDLVLATAVAGNATHLVTGDRGLLRLGTYQGIVILPPRDFLDLLMSAANSPTTT